MTKWPERKTNLFRASERFELSRVRVIWSRLHVENCFLPQNQLMTSYYVENYVIVFSGGHLGPPSWISRVLLNVKKKVKIDQKTNTYLLRPIAPSGA